MHLNIPINPCKKIIIFYGYQLPMTLQVKELYSHHTILGGFVNNINIITISSDIGAGKKGAYKGPKTVIEHLNFNQKKCSFTHIEPLESPDNLKHEFAKGIDDIVRIQTHALDKINSLFTDKSGFNLIISGDHSNGHIGISAVKESNPEKKIGVIWIDAHADLHNPSTTPSGNMHGMPLAMSLGIAINPEAKNQLTDLEKALWSQLLQIGSKQICPKITPESLVFIELRDFEDEETAIIDQFKIKCFTPEDRKKSGVKKLAEQTLNYLSDCDFIYISFDVDSMDPSVSEGTGTPVPGGLSKQEAIELLSILLKSPKVIALEFTEINPDLPQTNSMVEVAADILNQLF
jgi:arginase